MFYPYFIVSFYSKENSTFLFENRFCYISQPQAVDMPRASGAVSKPHGIGRISPDNRLAQIYHPDAGSDNCGLAAYSSDVARKISDVLDAGECMCHRGSGTDRGADGAGVLFEMSDDFKQELMGGAGVVLAKDNTDEYSAEVSDLQHTGVGMVFFSEHDENKIDALTDKIYDSARKRGVEIKAWRQVPVDESVLRNDEARKERPVILQPIFEVQDGNTREEIEHICDKAWADLEHEFKGQGAHFASFSTESIVYKGMLTPGQLRSFYAYDLGELAPDSKNAIFHVRYATNTSAGWDRAQPFNKMAHNGEINTLYSLANNVLKIEGLRANERRALELAGEQLEESAGRIQHILTRNSSDSQVVNAVLNDFIHSGFSLLEAMSALVQPAARTLAADIREEVMGIYEYYQKELGLVADGPAGIIAMSRGELMAVSDRLGLRPIRWRIIRDNEGRESLEISSEDGAFMTEGTEIRKGQLQPGEKILRTATGEIIPPEQVNERLVQLFNARGIQLDQHAQNVQYLAEADVDESQYKTIDVDPALEKEWKAQMAAHGWNERDLDFFLCMCRDGKEPVHAMGWQYPTLAMSAHPELWRSYMFFKQKFAQVTNPPIDPIREAMLMDMTVFVGGRAADPSAIVENNDRTGQAAFRLDSPVMNSKEHEAMRQSTQTIEVDAVFGKGETMKHAIERLQNQVLENAQSGDYSIIMLDDALGCEEGKLPIPMPIALHAALSILDKHNLRGAVDIAIAAGDVAEAHDINVLLAMGAKCVYGRTMFQSIKNLSHDGENVRVPAPWELKTDTTDEGEEYQWSEPGKGMVEMSCSDAEANIHKALDLHLRKIWAKMGITTANGYFNSLAHGQLGLKVVTDMYDDYIGGIGYGELEQIERKRRKNAEENQDVASLEEEYDTVRDTNIGEELPKIVRDYKNEGLSPEERARTRLVDWMLKVAIPVYLRIHKGTGERHPMNPADLLLIEGYDVSNPEELRDEIEEFARSVPMEFVLKMVKRLESGAMSHGAIGELVHEAIGFACNRLGMDSCTGEGGIAEDRTPGTRNSISQVASGRFGVDLEYLIDGEAVQIKMAQGAKPGEGGELPGRKVDWRIGKNRNVEPGTDLISPPPHHDIYSIEDLSQLIYDLKNASWKPRTRNELFGLLSKMRSLAPQAHIEVKLAAGPNVGTVACGVAKAGASAIVIDGMNAGTGAAPGSSRPHTGFPIELGIAEAHKALCAEGLRQDVRLNAGGGVKTGAEMFRMMCLGADRCIVGQLSMLFGRCTMMRTCFANCDTAVALEKKLKNLKRTNPEEYDRLLGEISGELEAGYLSAALEFAFIMKKLGFKDPQEIVGRTDLLYRTDELPHVDVSSLLERHEPKKQTYHPVQEMEQKIEDSTGAKLFNGSVQRFLSRRWNGSKKSWWNRWRNWRKPEQEREEWDEMTIDWEEPLRNTDLSVGTYLSSQAVRLAQQYGCDSRNALPDGKRITMNFTGTAGQSFGAWLAKGVKLDLRGGANDYVGKGLSGGRIVVRAADNEAYEAHENSRVGNVCGFGAIGGEIMVNGRSGHRFAARNSGADQYCEGAGILAMEYMTGGRTVILGSVGEEIGAGMSAGKGFLYNADGSIPDKVDTRYVMTQQLSGEEEQELRGMLEEYAQETNSTRAHYMLEHWEQEKANFIMVVPKPKAEQPASPPPPPPPPPPAVADERLVELPIA